ncbi:HTH_Tnp_Tc3_2 domain-containing protein [Trichonephila clavipes]|nr:HTH_Tnp_Tc3_2 domain-containing protein [Trichonephila clavipes]
MGAVWSARSSQVRRCWDQWIQETSFTRPPGSGCPRQISHREDHHIIRHAHVEPTSSLAAVQTQAAPVSSQTVARGLAVGHLVSRRPLPVLPMTPTNASVWTGVAHDGIGSHRNETSSS